METSDYEGGNQILQTTAAETRSNSYSALPSADVNADRKSFHQQSVVGGASSEQFNQTNEQNDVPTNIVMSPADFSDVVEETGERQMSRTANREGALVGAFRSSQEQIQLSIVESDALPDTAESHSSGVGRKMTDKMADQQETSASQEPQETEEEIDHKFRTDADESQASEDGLNAQTTAKIRRRKSLFLSQDSPKKESLEPYKIDIPLRKKVNKSTKKKLWREIERRKPFITQNVIEHIRTYAKPPFVTWGCRNCEFPYESE